MMIARTTIDWGERLFRHSTLSFLLYRYRYLCIFTAVGFLSIVLELLLFRIAEPLHWPWRAKAIMCFGLGLLFSFALNARLNFHVSPRYLLGTFGRFCLVSCLSFGLNMLAVAFFREVLPASYGTARLVSSALLFLLAYALHRRYTFDLARNYGVAVYAARGEDVDAIYARLGHNCDHVHIDLVDETMNADAAPVDLAKIEEARRLWRGLPVAAHIMSLEPGRWVDELWHQVDWLLFHVNVDDDLFGLIFRARQLGKKVGVVWHVSVSPAELLPYLPHVDFVMVLGIERPGQSGQCLLGEAVAVCATLDRLRGRYGFEVMFDGGVSAQTAGLIRARYLVAASAVLRAPDPVRASHSLRTGARYERRSA